MKDVLMKFPIMLNEGYEVETIESEKTGESITRKMPKEVEKQLVFRAMSMEEYFEGNAIEDKQKLWEYILAKQLVAPYELKNIKAWSLNIGRLKMVISIMLGLTLDPYSERRLPFHTEYSDLTGI